MDETSKNARIAGALYVLLGVVAPIRLMYIPGELFVKGDAAATAANLAAHESLFRFGILTDVLAGTLGLFVGLALYRLFKDVDRSLATLMVILGALMVTPIYFLNTLNDAAALWFATDVPYLAAFTDPQRDAMAYLFLRLHGFGVAVNQVFWGLWLFPLGLLMWRSGFLPKTLGVLLFINGFAYVIQAVVDILWPLQSGTVSSWLFPALMGELVVMLWLLIMGTKTKTREIQHG
jgi:uncharacterized membrane protein YeaQ/YmgE (transglycosylase-associated protein family)